MQCWRSTGPLRALILAWSVASAPAASAKSLPERPDRITLANRKSPEASRHAEWVYQPSFSYGLLASADDSVSVGAGKDKAQEEPASAEKTAAELARLERKDRLSAKPSKPTAERVERSQSFFAPSQSPDRPRSDIGIPIVSFILPGFDQWWEGQTGSAFAYTGVALGGYVYQRATLDANDLEYAKKVRREKCEQTADKCKDQSEIEEKDVAARKVTLGGLLAQGAGGMSLYHSFRTAVHTRQSHGQYEFLTHEETPLELFAAPFHFQYLARTSTFVPLLVGAGIAYLQVRLPPDSMEKDRFTSADAAFAGAFAYNAGTHEEAVFRGWLMPVMREYWGSDFWSNAAQSVTFALAHLNNVSTPLPQLILGYHLGNVTQDNGWQLGESIFIHTWWDVMAFVALYQYKLKEPDPKKAAAIKPVLWLPPLEYLF